MAELCKKGAVSTVTCQCAPHVRWAVEIRGIILVDQNTGSAHSLSYPQAAVWDLINRGYLFDQSVHMLCVIASMEVKEAERFIYESLDEWTKAGFLITGEEHG